MSDTFYTSDPHAFHPLMARLRGFVTSTGAPDVPAMMAWYESMWRAQAGDDDTVFVLGDATVGGTERVEATLNFFARLPGCKVLIAGNHDEVHPDSPRSIRRDVNEMWLSVFDSILPFGLRRLSVDGKRTFVRLSHFPYSGDHTREDRFDSARLKDTGAWLLHGHTHKVDQRIHEGRQLHVGIDAWGRLLTEREVTQLLALGPAPLTRKHPAERDGYYQTPSGKIPFAPLGTPEAP